MFLGSPPLWRWACRARRWRNMLLVRRATRSMAAFASRSRRRHQPRRIRRHQHQRIRCPARQPEERPGPQPARQPAVPSVRWLAGRSAPLAAHLAAPPICSQAAARPRRRRPAVRDLCTITAPATPARLREAREPGTQLAAPVQSRRRVSCDPARPVSAGGEPKVDRASAGRFTTICRNLDDLIWPERSGA